MPLLEQDPSNPIFKLISKPSRFNSFPRPISFYNSRQSQGVSMDLFEAYFVEADLDDDGRISGAEAVAFFRGSGLPKPILAEIWTFADKNRNGYLDRQEFYDALKLVTVAQSKRDLTPVMVKAALYGPASSKIPPPQMTFAHPPAPQSPSVASSSPVPMGAVTPTGTQKVGSSPRNQNMILNNHTPGNQPFRPSQGLRTTTAPHTKQSAPGPLNLNQTQLPWPKMTTPFIQKHTKAFIEVDTDLDGKITGEQARNMFLSSRLPREVLMQLWDLADQDGDSMLTLKEFCIAFYLMDRYREGGSLPVSLPDTIMSGETLIQTTGFPNSSHGFGPAKSVSASGPMAPAAGSRLLIQSPQAEVITQVQNRTSVLDNFQVNRLNSEQNLLRRGPPETPGAVDKDLLLLQLNDSGSSSSQVQDIAEASELEMALNVSIQFAVNIQPELTSNRSSQLFSGNYWEAFPNLATYLEWAPSSTVSSIQCVNQPIGDIYRSSDYLSPELRPKTRQNQNIGNDRKNHGPSVAETAHVYAPSAPMVSMDFLDKHHETWNVDPIYYPVVDINHVGLSSGRDEVQTNNFAKVETEASYCVICWETPKEAACVPCGHVAGCMPCLTKITTDRGACPICRAKIDQVIKLYSV